MIFKTKFQPLRRTMIMWFLLTGLIPLGLVSWFSYQQAYKSLIQDAEKDLNHSSELSARFIRNWFDYRFMDLNSQAASHENIQFLEQLKSGLKKSSAMPKNYVKSHDWAELVDNESSYLNSYSRLYDYIYDLFLIDNDGNILYTVAHESDLGTSLQEGAYAKTQFASAVNDTLKTGQATFSGLEPYAPSNNTIAGFMVAPMYDERGNILGAFAIKLRLDRTFNLLNKSRSDDSYMTNYLVDKEGHLLTSVSNESNEFVLESVTDVEQLALFREELEGSSTNTEINIAEYISPSGRKVFGIHHLIKIVDINWVLVSETNSDKAWASADKLKTLIVLLVGLTIFILIFWAIYLARRITQPITLLADASMKVAAGDINQMVDVSANNEIGKLAESFNHMLKMRQFHEHELEQSAIESQNSLDALTDQKFALDQHAIVAITDAGGTITFANDKFSEISGYSRDELIGQNHRLLNSGYHEKEFFTEMFETISGGKVWHSEVCNKAKDGNLYWVDTTIVPFMDDNGKPESYIAIRADITERKQTENALSDAKVEADKAFADLNQQKFALDQHAIVAITDAGGTITFANDKFSEISGYSRDELIGQNHRLLNSGYHEKEFFTEMFETISHGQVWHAEICNKAKDGSFYWVDTTIVPFMDDNGKPESYVAIRTDITERKQTEDALIEARFEAEAAVLAKGEFLASMSHEIRTPMNGVLGMLGLLMNTKLNDDQHHKAKIAQSSAQSLLTLINDILDFSKVEAGKLDLEIIDFKLYDMFGEFSDAMALQAQDKGLELVLDLTGVDQTMVKGDPGRLRQILTNLVSNAIKFTTDGEVIIRVALQEADDLHWRLFCTVTDTGIGIPADKIKSLFDSFSQVDASTTRKYGGTGLGLSIVKKLCEIMDGSVEAGSDPGKGSRFEINLLLEKSKHSKQVVPQVDMKSLTLLVVDDNKTNREVLRQQLEQWGANVVQAENGKQALAICEDRVQRLDHQTSDKPFFDIAFLDMQIPGMDGAELGQVLKEDERFSKMKLVMMTSMGSQGDVKRFAEIGFSAHFHKPATTADLLDALAVVVEGGETLEQSQSLVTNHYLKSLREDKYDQRNEDRFESMPCRVKWPANSRVLLVEDNEINQLVAKGLMKEFGLQIEVASNGDEAIDMLRHEEDEYFQLVLMDCEMPIMDGYDATRGIRSGNAGAHHKEIPIVAMTANVMQGIREKCKAAGMDDYLAKPIEPELLRSKLQEWLLGENTDPQQTIEKPEINITEPELEVWDNKAALKRLMGDEVLLMSVLDAFISDIPVRLEELQQALDAGDYDQVYRSAHNIKGVAGNLSGLSLQQQAALVEDAAKEENMDQLIVLVPVLQQAHQQLMDCFKAYKLDQKPEASSVISDEELITRLQKLEGRLQKSDYIDQQELTPLKQTNMGVATQELLDQFVEQISQIDNSAALKTLAQIANKEAFKLLEEIS